MRTLLLWQPTEFLNYASRCPRPHDQTYAAFRFRETVCEGVTYLHQIERPNEAAGIVIRADQVWTGTLLKAWMQQVAQTRQYPPLDSTVYCAILCRIFSLLGPRDGVEAHRHGLPGAPGGGRHQNDTAQGPRPGGPHFVLMGSRPPGTQ